MLRAVARSSRAMTGKVKAYAIVVPPHADYRGTPGGRGTEP
jgi:hypothetical protein